MCLRAPELIPWWTGQRACLSAVTDKRTNPAFVADERTSLREWLQFQRETLEWKCEGLDRDGLIARPIPSSLLSLHGLVRHMAEVERSWFRRALTGEDAGPLYYDDDQHPDGDFELIDEADWSSDLATWKAECEHARALEAAAPSLDVTGIRRGEPVDLRWIMVHMIEEYARHNGHADLISELIDGSVGD
jgi:uncharacterized damage-inducible protein DinB